MSKGVKKVIGLVASIAIPFVAPSIAGAMGISSAIGKSLVGAGLGAAAAKASGGNALLGAALGGFGTFARTSGMFGGGAKPGMTTGTPLASAAGNMPPVAGAGAGAASGVGGAAAITGGGAAGIGSTAATGGMGIGAGLKAGFAGMLSNPAGLAQLAMTVFGKSPQELTPQEQDRMKELEELAATDRALFNQRVDEARSLLQQGNANPEQAYATAALATQRGLEEANRTGGLSERPGLRTSDRRRGAIESARVGTSAVAGENARAAQTKATGLSALPTRAPDGAGGLQLAIYSDLEQRRRDYRTDLANSVGNMFGSIA